MSERINVIAQLVKHEASPAFVAGHRKKEILESTLRTLRQMLISMGRGNLAENVIPKRRKNFGVNLLIGEEHVFVIDRKLYQYNAFDTDEKPRMK